MSGNRIVVNPELLKKLSLEMQTTSSNLKAMENRLSSLIRGLEVQGMQKGNIENMFTEMHKCTNNVAKYTDDIASFLNEKAKTFEEADGIKSGAKNGGINNSVLGTVGTATAFTATHIMANTGASPERNPGIMASKGSGATIRDLGYRPTDNMVPGGYATSDGFVEYSQTPMEPVKAGLPGMEKVTVKSGTGAVIDAFSSSREMITQAAEYQNGTLKLAKTMVEAGKDNFVSKAFWGATALTLGANAAITYYETGNGKDVVTELVSTGTNAGIGTLVGMGATALVGATVGLPILGTVIGAGATWAVTSALSEPIEKWSKWAVDGMDKAIGEYRENAKTNVVYSDNPDGEASLYRNTMMLNGERVKVVPPKSYESTYESMEDLKLDFSQNNREEKISNNNDSQIQSDSDKNFNDLMNSFDEERNVFEQDMKDFDKDMDEIYKQEDDFYNEMNKDLESIEKEADVKPQDSFQEKNTQNYSSNDNNSNELKNNDRDYSEHNDRNDTDDTESDDYE